MKSVLISIRPEWCEKIASGEKTVEVRKTRPNIELPFKCYIYCTKVKFRPHEHLRNNLRYDDSTIKVCEGQGKVIGEFVCHWIRRESEVALGLVDVVLEKTSCMDYRQIMDYADGGDLYTWNISDLVIYDKPKKINEFVSASILNTNCFGQHLKLLDRPPQSWCYVEEVTK